MCENVYSAFYSLFFSLIFAFCVPTQGNPFNIVGTSLLKYSPRQSYFHNHVKKAYPPKYNEMHVHAAQSLGFAANILKKGVYYFENTLGFSSLMNDIYRTHSYEQYGYLKGYLYELEVAIALQESGNTVTAFHEILRHPTDGTAREIDIIATGHYHKNKYGLLDFSTIERDLSNNNKPLYCIECKNIYWSFVDQKKEVASKLKRQFEEQNKIIKACAQSTQQPLYHVIFSKNPIPNSWKQWFVKHAIIHLDKPLKIISHHPVALA